MTKPKERQLMSPKCLLKKRTNSASRDTASSVKIASPTPLESEIGAIKLNTLVIMCVAYEYIDKG
jgi:hypothetical protein